MGAAIKVSAAAAGALGVVAVLSAAPWAAVGAGLAAVVTAGLVLRGAPTAATDRAEPAATDGSAPDVDRPRLLAPAMVAPTFEARVVSARRALRPVSVVMFDITVESDEGRRRLERDTVVRSADTALREADVIGLGGDGTFVLILEDTGEDGAVWTAERLRRHVLESISPVRFVAGVATYPNHGLDAETVLGKAQTALAGAREWPQDRIEVASAS